VGVTIEDIDEEVRGILHHLAGEAVNKMIGLLLELLIEMDNIDLQDK
jgi:hypothetical protein